MEKATLEREIPIVKLDSYHSLEYLKNKSKGNKTKYILPNGKEVEIDGK